MPLSYLSMELGQPLYQHSDPDKLLKVISTPGVSHFDFRHVKIPTPFRICTRRSCTLLCMISHDLATRSMMITLQRIRDLQLKKDPIGVYFPTVFDLNMKKKYVVVEKVPHNLHDRCPVDFQAQLQDLNSHLVRLGYNIDDVHHKNIMVDDQNRIKIIDGEIYTKKELEYQKNLLDKIDDSQTKPSQPYVNASNIFVWIDGRLSGEDVCNATAD